MTISQVAVVGAGTIGASWAALFLAHGLEVTAFDPGPGAEARLRRQVAAAWPIATGVAGLRTDGAVAAPATPAALRFTDRLSDAVAGAQWVQESGPEQERLKAALFTEIDRYAMPDAVIASSSSGLILRSIQVHCQRPERCVIGHPFNPPHLIPLVEVVGSAQTSVAAIDTAMSFYRALGKYPIHVKREVPGHVANRLQAALWREAVHLVDCGVASVADVDAALTQGPGLRWAVFGAHMTFHLGGGDGGLRHFMDHLLGPMHDWWSDLGQPMLTDGLQQRLVEGVQAEAAGRDLQALARQRDETLVALLAALHARG